MKKLLAWTVWTAGIGSVLFFTKAQKQPLHNPPIESLVTIQDLKTLQSDLQSLNVTFTSLKAIVESLLNENQKLKQRVEDTEVFVKFVKSIAFPCLVAGGGLLTLYIITKILQHSKQYSKQETIIQLPNEQKITTTKTEICYFINDLFFLEKKEMKICSSLDNFQHPQYKFKRVLNENQSHFSIVSDDVKQREETMASMKRKVYLSIGLLGNGMPAENEIRISRDDNGAIEMNDMILHKLIKLLEKFNVNV